MMSRRILGNRRPHELFDIEHDGMRYTVRVGRFDDGRLAEVFINSTKVGSAVDINARDGAILVSLLLQNSVDIDMVLHSLYRNSGGNPSGLIGRVIRLIGGGA
jgi:hypothetical protein